jgi:hypothetical protein
MNRTYRLVLMTTLTLRQIRIALAGLKVMVEEGPRDHYLMIAEVGIGIEWISQRLSTMTASGETYHLSEITWQQWQQWMAVMRREKKAA